MRRQSGFTLMEVLVVMAILGVLSMIMIYSVNGARKVGIASQTVSVAQQKARFVDNILERDIRQAGSGLFMNAYRAKNEGDGTNGPLPDDFDYDIQEADLEGFMIPPIEVVNGTDDDPGSYLNPMAATINLTNAYREPGTDIITMFRLLNTGFSGSINDVTGVGQENFMVVDPVLGARLYSIFHQLGGAPILIYIIDNSGEYATLRAVTEISLQASGEYRIKMEPSNTVNQPTNFKDFLEGIYPELRGNPALFRSKVGGDDFGQITAVSYFLYRHPDPAEQAEGWLVRLDLPVMSAEALNIDASNPSSIRPFVIADHVADFQIAFGVDTNEDGSLDNTEWHNDESMENYMHTAGGGGTVTAEFRDLVNNLIAVRFSVVTYTDDTSADDPYGFADPNSPGFTSNFPSVGDLSSVIGISSQLEDHAWSYTELLTRLWYHRAIQLSWTVNVRNMDLDNIFARTQ